MSRYFNNNNNAKYQKEHRPQQHAAEIHEEILLKQPPSSNNEECLICMLPQTQPSIDTKKKYHNNKAGKKIICSGCTSCGVFAKIYSNEKRKAYRTKRIVSAAISFTFFASLHIASWYNKPISASALNNKSETKIDDNNDNNGDITPAKKNVMAYSLYGNSPRYWGGPVIIAQLAEQYFPGWTVRFYHNNSAPKEYSWVLDDLKLIHNVELYDMTNSSLTILNPAMWRFHVAIDPDVTGAYTVRDVDSRPSQREASAVQQWLLQSNYSFHNMHDHPNHCWGHPMSAGMWGGRIKIPEMKCVIEHCNNNNNNNNMPSSKSSGSTTKDDPFAEYWDDQNQLEKYIWPIVKKSVMQHDSVCCKTPQSKSYWKDSKPFPTKRKGGEHIGSAFINPLDAEPRQNDMNGVLNVPECEWKK